ncbi:BrnA antitoxin family protein [Roseobacter sp. HKCCA0434]|uniref:BrnA antitoxin family protein n=1 Tax=Roseobacter sp. HKCCA0434 TaxID=3079297 RepID=UPI002905DCA7|nr:BrnA antitoxin family protein [Roseobacter sp. HKCCA0434]
MDDFPVDDKNGRKLTRAQLRAETEMAMQLDDWLRETRAMLTKRELIPEAWHEIEAEHPCHNRVKLTIRVDADVAKFYRAMGTGYGARMNAILRTWMMARKAMVIEGKYDRTLMDLPL